MPLPPLFRRLMLRGAGAAPATATPAAAPGPEEAHATLRIRARRRLIGATVLVAAAVVGLPLLFESQPRPIPSDVSIDVRGRDDGAAAQTGPVAVPRLAVPRALAPAAPPAVTTERPAAPAADNAAAPIAEAPAETGATTATTAPRTDTPAVPSRGAPSHPASPVGDAREVGSHADSARVKALLDGRPVEGKPVAAAAPTLPSSAVPSADGVRYIVQVGAFADANAVTAARGKAERSGLKTYTQVIQSPAGARTRVRVGPYASLGDADRAVAQLKSAGLPGVVLTLDR